jgi:hypothetical protein
MSVKELTQKYNIKFQEIQNHNLAECSLDQEFEDQMDELIEGKPLIQQLWQMMMVFDMPVLTDLIERYEKETGYDESKCIQDMLKLYYQSDFDMKVMERIYPSLMAASVEKPILRVQGDEIMLEIGKLKKEETNE